MDETRSVQKQNSCKVVVSKFSSNVCSMCAGANFHMTFVVCVSADKFGAPPLLILPGNYLNRGVLEGCNIEGAYVTTASKRFINSNSLLNCIELFANYFPGSVTRPLVLIYDGCCSH